MKLINLCLLQEEFKIAKILEENLAEEIEAEETFIAVKEDALNDEFFKPAQEERSPAHEEGEEELVSFEVQAYEPQNTMPLMPAMPAASAGNARI
jgi:hypothetical protein